MNNTEALIKNILSSTSYEGVFPDLDNYKKTYLDYVRVLHPDVCTHPDASAAVSKLNQYKDIIENGESYKDEVSEIVCVGKKFSFTGDKAMLKKSYTNYRQLVAFTGQEADFFRKYLPMSMEILKDTELESVVYERAVPLSKIITHFGGTVPVEHTNWILNRMLEIICWLADVGYVHAGINPESILILPENHGLVLSTFYHTSKIGAKLTTVSGKYSRLYPASTFKEKIATPAIDIELAKRTAIYMLGDTSGIGNKLHKLVPPEMLAFYRKKHTEPNVARLEYKDILKRSFEKKFHILHL